MTSQALRATEDRRVRRTRTALTETFLELVVERPYDDIAVGDIIERAGVGRSTFYQHFANKEDLLRQSLAPGFEALGESLDEGRDPERLVFWAEAFWTNRRVARVLLSGEVRPFLVRTLATEIQPRLGELSIPTPLAAMQIAEAQLGLVHAWMTGRTPCAASDIAEALAVTSRAMAEALGETRHLVEDGKPARGYGAR
jgi:AcrR family transcriptional regulator